MSKFLLLIIPLMMDIITPEIRTGVDKWLTDMEKKADATPNPWDNMFTGFLRMVLSGRTE